MTKHGVPYLNEYIIIFHAEKQADGSYKLIKAKEFVDSKFSAGFMAQMQEIAASSSS